MRTVLSILVADKFGALSRILELFVSRGYNLHSICSGICEKEGAHRMSIVCNESQINVQRIVKLIRQIVDVHEVSLMEPESSVVRELLLMKINFREENLSEELREILSIVNSVRCKVIELNNLSITFEYVGNARELDSLITIFRRFEITELARTGEAAIHQ